MVVKYFKHDPKCKESVQSQQKNVPGALCAEVQYCCASPCATLSAALRK